MHIFIKQKITAQYITVFLLFAVFLCFFFFFPFKNLVSTKFCRGTNNWQPVAAQISEASYEKNGSYW